MITSLAIAGGILIRPRILYIVLICAIILLFSTVMSPYASAESEVLFQGYVTFKNGTPAPDANVYLTYGGYTWKGGINASGFYSFGCWYYGGPATLKVWYMNSQYDEYTVTPLANSTVNKNFALTINTPTPPPPGVTWRGYVTYNGTPVSGASVAWSYGGYTDTSTTDSTGFYSFGCQYIGGTSTLKASYNGVTSDVYSSNPAQNAIIEKNFALVPPQADNKPPVAKFSYYRTGESLTTYYFDALGSSDPDGSIVRYAWDFGDGYTDSGIKVSHTYTSDGRYSPVLTVTDNLGATDTDSVAIDIITVPPPQPIPFILLIAAMAFAVVILLAMVILYLWLKRSLKIAPATMSIPCDGKTQVPVKVSFVNGFGREVKQRSDLDVELKTTSGSIQNVTIPEGKSYVKAMLVPSNEFGRAALTAKAGNKTAKAEVDFVSDRAAFEVSVNPGSIVADGRSTADVTLRIRDGNGNIIAPIQERDVLLKSTMGEIRSPVKIARGTEARSVIVSSSTGGTAAITAISGDIKGEGSVAFTNVPRRYCMLCGAMMAMEDKRCARCGSVPPSGEDVKTCGNCDTVIPEAARYCHKCGAGQPMTKK
jgi:hypothetical protein